MKDKFLSVKEAAEFRNVTTYAIMAAIKSKRLPFSKKKGMIFIKLQDILAYNSQLYSRVVCKKYKDRCCTVAQVSKIFNIPKNRIYFMIYSERIHPIKIGHSYYIPMEDNKDALSREGTNYPHPLFCGQGVTTRASGRTVKVNNLSLKEK